VDPKRPTTVKSRVIARNQHVVRLDRESRSDIPAEIEEEIIGGFSLAAGDFQAVIFQDYNKGVATPKIISAIIDICRRKDIFVAVDPKFHNFFQYRRVNLFKPNVKETEAALVAKIHTEADLLECGKRIFQLLEPDYLLITMGAKGSALFQNQEEKPVYLSTIARQVHDVSGAGDTVIATIVAFYAAGASLYEAAVISNYAAGTVCEEVGVVAVNREKLKKALLSE
jgi:rfaE bifunctional protein kinase chain/domain